MGFLKNNDGFSMISMLLSISLLALSLPFIGYIIKALQYESAYEALSIHQFFILLRDELSEAQQVHVNPHTIHYVSSPSNTPTKIASISQYKQLIRRQLDGRGHEVYVQDIKSIYFEKTKAGIKVTVYGREGGLYEKNIALYQTQ